MNNLLEVWFNSKTREQITLEGSEKDLWYLEMKNGCRCVSGINLYWLMNNGFKRVA